MPVINKKRNLSKLALACLCALALAYCFRICVQAIHFGQDTVTIRVLHGNEVNGATEVWIAENANKYDLANYTVTAGDADAFEYRSAAEYGYTANMLVSSGDNVGVEVAFPHWSEQNYQIDLYMQPFGGVIEVGYQDKTREVSLYADEAIVQPVVFSTQGLSDDKWLAISLALVALLTLLGYRALCRVQLTAPAEPALTDAQSEKAR